MLRYYLQQIKWNQSAGSKWNQITYFKRWKRALRGGSNTMQDRLPWLTFPAIDLLQRSVKRSDRVFEYGGGGSTLFWADHAGEVVTVEHDPTWFAALEEQMATEQKINWKGIHVPAEPTIISSGDPAEPQVYASADPDSKGKNYKAYVQVIDGYPDAHFDVVLIDGRARAACLYHAVVKLKSGGLLVLDNAERTYYTANNHKALDQLTPVLSGMAPVLHGRDFSETRIYRKR